MNRITSIRLGGDLTVCVEGDVIPAGMPLLKGHDVKLTALRSSLMTGEQSGTSPRSVSHIWAAVKQEHLRQTALNYDI